MGLGFCKDRWPCDDGKSPPEDSCLSHTSEEKKQKNSPQSAFQILRSASDRRSRSSLLILCCIFQEDLCWRMMAIRAWRFFAPHMMSLLLLLLLLLLQQCVLLLLLICEKSLRETLGLVLQGVGMLGLPGSTEPSTHTNELHASKHASSKSLDNQSLLPSVCSKKPPLFFSSQSFLFLTLFLVLGVFFSWFSSSPSSSSPYPPASSSSKPLEILLSAMHAADSCFSSSSSSATHLPFLLRPLNPKMTLAVGNLSKHCQFPLHYYSYHQRKQNCADEEGAAIPGTAKAPAATSPHNNNHLHNTLLLQLQMLLLFAVRLHVRPSVCLCLSPEFKGGSFSAHKLTLQQTQNEKKKKKGSGKAQQQQ